MRSSGVEHILKNHKTAQPRTLLLATAVVLNTGEAWRPTPTPIGE